MNEKETLEEIEKYAIELAGLPAPGANDSPDFNMIERTEWKTKLEIGTKILEIMAEAGRIRRTDVARVLAGSSPVSNPKERKHKNMYFEIPERCKIVKNRYGSCDLNLNDFLSLLDEEQVDFDFDSMIRSNVVWYDPETKEFIYQI